MFRFKNVSRETHCVTRQFLFIHVSAECICFSISQHGVCLYLCLSPSVCGCVPVCLSLYFCISECLWAPVYVGVSLCLSLCLCMCPCLSVCMYSCVPCVYVPVCLRVVLCACVPVTLLSFCPHQHKLCYACCSPSCVCACTFSEKTKTNKKHRNNIRNINLQVAIGLLMSARCIDLGTLLSNVSSIQSVVSIM